MNELLLSAVHIPLPLWASADLETFGIRGVFSLFSLRVFSGVLGLEGSTLGFLFIGGAGGGVILSSLSGVVGDGVDDKIRFILLLLA